MRLKKMIRCCAVCSISVFLLTGCFHHEGSGQANVSPAQSPTPKPVETGAVVSPTSGEALLQGMTLEEKIGQMIFAGIDDDTLNSHTQELIVNYHVGGIILYKTNIKTSNQLVGLVNDLKRTNKGNKLSLWIGADEEGGKVTRLPDEITKTPTNKEIGKTNNKEFAYGIGRLLGKELNAYGLNVDFAPVLDINSNPKNPVIGDRSYGSNATIVNAMGIQTMKGLQSQRVLSVVKHFPGHGDTGVDSHIGLPIVQNDLARLRRIELVPFAEAIQQQADAVMVAHILLPKVDGQNPASMSSVIMTDLLRKEMGFKGLIMTDDLTMGAIAKNYDLGEAAVKSVRAGTNVILVGHEFEKVVTVIEALKKAVQTKQVSMQMINQSVGQIMSLKQKYQINDKVIQTPDTKQINNDAHQLLNTYIRK
ncbi:beta-N-acetylhexosaminidase [Paenibacillus sp. N3.4]|uniref:beta-N-acetylhexosaminidase n=1 Tax=Paenibacillus sp. N3.4 TaxID=2603222 RepID=UPI0011C77D61|nr:beta-N-acetylhexosaminidase [Paenibacillus sp. N3.4]TXK73841.1 beta-N-acetylhexosaminidase [Paenibacillus sp. N3.4]